MGSLVGAEFQFCKKTFGDGLYNNMETLQAADLYT